METSAHLFVPDNCETLRCLCITDITDNFKYVASVSGRGGLGTRIFFSEENTSGSALPNKPDRVTFQAGVP